MEINNILDELLINNDKHIIKLILSFLDKCPECDRYDLIKRYFVNIGSRYTTKWEEKDYCYKCMVEVMLNSNRGKSGVLTWGEYVKDTYNYNP